MPEQLYERLKMISVASRKPIWRLISPYVPAMQSAFLDEHAEEIKALQEKLRSGETLNEILSRPDWYWTATEGIIDLKSDIIEEKAKEEIEEEATKSEAGINIWNEEKDEQ